MKIKSKQASIILIIIFALVLSSCGKIKRDREWNLVLVNKENKIPKNYDFELLKLSNGQEVNVKIYPDLQRMFDDMRAEGLDPKVTSGYRSTEYQKELFDEGVASRINMGMTKEEAIKDTNKRIALPGTSEHEIGLAVDIGVRNEASDLDAVYNWLANNAHNYGSILRYPYGKTDITGINFEPWHYRYVGIEHAKAMYENDLTLEEYLK